MSASTCPTCKTPIDPARAPVARVRGGKIVTFCSAVCADAPADTQTGAPTRAATTADTPAALAPATRDAAGHDYAVLADRAEPAPRGNGKRRIIALSSAILVGGMAITIINAVSPSTPSDVRAASDKAPVPAQPTPASEGPGSNAAGSAAAVEEPRAPEPPVPADPQALFERAQTTLHTLMASPSLRVQRIAAMALSRLADAKAIERLASLLGKEPSELGRIEIAYAMARASDPRGKKLLVEALKHERRDVRLDAARSLVQLHDDAGNQVLQHMLSLSTHRIGAAGFLARSGDAEGLAALREELASSDSSQELKMRALVALGRAGDAAVKPQLLEILEDGRYHVGAADALAALQDRAAVPALIRQLALPSLRVRAALGLRRLGETGPLDELAAALDTGSEAARVSAAEAILILAGPEKLAEFD